MKNKIILTLVVGVLVTGLAACDLFDPTNAENPNVLESDFLNQSSSMERWLQGLDRQMTLSLNVLSNDLESGYIASAEIASDNYVNTRTFFNQSMDLLVFDITDQDIRTTMASLSNLRESAEFGLSTVRNRDETTTPDQEAEVFFYKGMSHLMTGEIYHLAPADSAGPPVPSAEQFNIAIDAFTQSLALSTDGTVIPSYHLALARTYRNLGDVANARAQAELAIAAGATYARFARHDNTNGPENDVQDALFDRGNFDDLQPLPRLDFLDPKYFPGANPNSNTGDDDDSDIAYLKSEEAYLILAEAHLAGGDLASAQSTLLDLVGVVSDRRTERLTDVNEDRTHLNPGARPNTADWMVAASAEDPFVAGLVISRRDEVRIPVISGTSISEADINALADVDSALETLYLMRQEIFIAEGRRMMDLGIKWPVPEREIENNVAINPGDPATIAIVPDFLPANEMDAFTMDETTREVVITHNLNRVLVQNRASSLVLPFF